MQVDLFASMDGQLLDAICERLQPTLFTPGTNVMEEGDRVSEMLFIVWGQLKSVTKSGGKVGSVTVGKLKPGLFCGEELLPWALDPKSGEILPYSASTVTAETEVEAFALKAEDLKFVATRFRRLHSKQLQHTFRHYSQKWRIWAACSIQAAWRRYVARKLEEARRREEESLRAPLSMAAGHSHGNASFGAALLVSRFAVNAMRSVHRLRDLHAAQQRLSSLKLQKPAEPDFSAEETD
jgi:cyclic nucleotide gated channel